MAELRCNSCGSMLPRGGLKYVIELKSFADFDGYLEEYPGDIEDGINELLDSMENMPTETLEEEVFQELVFILCKNCRERFVDDPFNRGHHHEEEHVNKGHLH